MARMLFQSVITNGLKSIRRLDSRKKSTKGQFYGLKLHIVSDLDGNLLEIHFTTGSVDDRVVLDKVLEKLKNSLVIADAGHVFKKLEKMRPGIETS